MKTVPIQINLEPKHVADKEGRLTALHHSREPESVFQGQ